MARGQEATPPTPPKLLTRQQLAVALGCHPQSLVKWAEEGLPVAVRGRGGRASLYDESAVRAWKSARDTEAAKKPDLATSRARKELAQAIEAEQRVAIRAKTLVHVEDVERVWSAHVAGVRARVLAIPTALADRVTRAAAIDGAAGVELVLQEAMHQVLSELSGGKLPVKRRTRRATKKRRRTVRRTRATSRRA